LDFYFKSLSTYSYYFMVGENISYAITNRCNYECGHCGVGSSPKGYVPGIEDVTAILSHLPRGTKTLQFTGGEPLQSRNLLYGALGYLKENEGHIFDKRPKISIGSNGSWLRNKNRALSIVDNLYRLGVSEVDVSLDKYHIEQAQKKLGWNMSDSFDTAGDVTCSGTISGMGKGDMKRLGEEIIEKYGREFKINVDYISPNAIKRHYPFERAKNLPSEELFDGPNYCLIQKNKMGSVTINPYGKVFPCCWERGPCLGSAIDEPVADLLERAICDEDMTLILKRGMNDFYIIRNGEPKDHDELVNQVLANPCKLCEKLFPKAE
jgi:hypothetical protein